jgi:hypothetical protein
MAAELDKWLIAKQKATVAKHPASGARPVQIQPVSGGGGGGILVKLFVIAVLGVLVVFTYQLLQERKEDIKKGIADMDGHGTTNGSSVPSPVPVNPPLPIPISLPVEDNVPDIAPDSEPIEIGNREEPVVVDAEPEPEPAEDLPPGDPELRERAIGLILDARKKRDKELADNASSLHFSVKAQSREAEPEVIALIEQLKGEIVDNRIPLTDGAVGLPEKILGAFGDALAKEESIDVAYGADLTRIRDAYKTRLDGAAADASDENLRKQLLAQGERASDLEAWIELLAPEPKRAPKRKSHFGFAGNWDNHSYNNTSRWIAHPDGKMEIVGEIWDVTWKLLNDGSLEVEWGKKAPYRYTREGDDWVGTNPHGGKASLKPGDW